MNCMFSHFSVFSFFSLCSSLSLLETKEANGMALVGDEVGMVIKMG